LQTADELAARQAVEELDARHAEEKLRLEQALREAEGRAERVRYALVYGTGAELVGAVAQVLTAAGLRTIDLDDELGGTRSADLLVGTDGPPWRLVEVKAASGSATDNLVNHPQRHLETWPQLPPGEPAGDDLTVFGHRLLADDYQVTVGDRSPGHRVALDLEHEQCSVADQPPGAARSCPRPAPPRPGGRQPGSAR
jgi:hypothetical protein